jgi:heme/copper-type cytochrome/quinol oxidase subunit 3
MNEPTHTRAIAAHSPMSSARLGTIVFVAAEAMLFIVLLAAYVVLRFKTHGFRGLSAVEPTTINALVPLLCIGLYAMHHARLGARARDARACRRGLAVSLAAGLGSVAVVMLQWQAWATAGMPPSADVKAGLAYLLSGAHIVHVAGGLLPAAVLTGRVFRRGAQPPSDALLNAHEIYWAFVAVVAVVILVLLHSA